MVIFTYMLKFTMKIHRLNVGPGVEKISPYFRRMAHGVATSTNLKLNAASLAPEKLAEVTPIWAAGLASTPHPIFQGFFLLDVGEVVRELCILQICGG